MTFSSLFAYPTEPAPDTATRLPFLSHWQHSQWNKLFALTQTYRYSAGDWVIRGGDSDRGLYLVAFGRLEVVGASAGKLNQRVALIEPGDITGEQSFLDGRSQPNDVRAVTDAETVRVSFEAFEIFAAREPGLARELALETGRIVSLRLRDVTSTTTRL